MRCIDYIIDLVGVANLLLLHKRFSIPVSTSASTLHCLFSTDCPFFYFFPLGRHQVRDFAKELFNLAIHTIMGAQQSNTGYLHSVVYSWNSNNLIRLGTAPIVSKPLAQCIVPVTLLHLSVTGSPSNVIALGRCLVRTITSKYPR